MWNIVAILSLIVARSGEGPYQTDTVLHGVVQRLVVVRRLGHVELLSLKQWDDLLLPQIKELLVQMACSAGQLPVLIMKPQREHETVQLEIMLVGVITAGRFAISALAVWAVRAGFASLDVRPFTGVAAVLDVESGCVRVGLEEARVTLHHTFKDLAQSGIAFLRGHQREVGHHLHAGITKPHLFDVTSRDIRSIILRENVPCVLRGEGVGVAPHLRKLGDVDIFTVCVRLGENLSDALCLKLNLKKNRTNHLNHDKLSKLIFPLHTSCNACFCKSAILLVFHRCSSGCGFSNLTPNSISSVDWTDPLEKIGRIVVTFLRMFLSSVLVMICGLFRLMI